MSCCKATKASIQGRPHAVIIRSWLKMTRWSPSGFEERYFVFLDKSYVSSSVPRSRGHGAHHDAVEKCRSDSMQ